MQVVADKTLLEYLRLYCFCFGEFSPKNIMLAELGTLVKAKFMFSSSLLCSNFNKFLVENIYDTTHLR